MITKSGSVNKTYIFLRRLLGRTRVYYLGAGGDDNNDGLTWETRKATTQGIENHVKPGDAVYTK